MQLELRTMLILVGVQGLVPIGLATGLWWTGRTYPGYSRWTLAGLLFVVTLCLLATRPTAPDWLSMVVANGVGAFGALLYLEGAREFRGLLPHSWFASAGCVVTTAAVALFVYVVPNQNGRAAVMSAFIGIVLLLASLTLLRRVPQGPTFGLRVTGYLFALNGTTHMIRAVYSALGPPLIDPLSGMHGALVLAFLGEVILFAVGFILIATEQGMLDLMRAKEAEAVLQESERHFRTLANAAPVMIWMSEVDKQVTYVNTPWLDFTGWPPNEVPGNRWIQLIHPDDVQRCGDAYVKAFDQREPFQVEHRLRRHDGEYRWTVSTGVPKYDPDGSFTGYVGTAVDVTERKIASDKLQEYERVIESAEEMIAVVDRDYRYLIANRKFLAMRNMSQAQVVGRVASEVLNKGVFETVIKERLDECFQGKVVRYEMKYAYPTLGERDVLVSYFPIDGAAGGVDRVACILQDITERKRTEEELASLTHRLIEAQEEERTRLARDLHDDLAQRMIGLAMQLHSVARVLPKDTSEHTRLRQACEQASALSQDIQAISHRLHSSNLEHLGLAVAAAGFCQELSGQHDLTIDFSYDGLPIDLPKDIALCLFRVLQEGVTNAFKHSRSREFQVCLWGRVSEIDLIVQDSGIGFDPEGTIGRGLGLTSMRERLKLVDGQLSIDSRPGHGTTLRARVPLTSRMEGAAAAG
jgi:PAS domain S-box-containing protein